jgi:sugar phosphate isomerase/epimerase
VNPLGIERLCMFDMPPVPFIELAAELGCPNVGLGLTSMGYYNPHGYAAWSLRDDPALRRDTIAALAANGVTISLLEGFAVQPGKDVREQAADLDIVHALGGRRINAVSTDRDMDRSCEGLAIIADMAAERGIEVVTEIGPPPIKRLDRALEAVRRIDRPNFRLLIDTMHFFRMGSTVEELAAIDPALVGYVQLCDVPLASPFESYMEEALHERMPPGQGELPLADVLALLRPDVVVSLEVPQRSLAEAGVAPRERVLRCVEAARTLMARAP